MAKISSEGSSGPVTIADLGREAHLAYAEGIRDYDVGLVRDSKDSLAVSTRTSVPTTSPSYKPLEIELFEETKRLPLADLPPIRGFPPDTLFAEEIVPHLDSKQLQQAISSVKGLEGEKKIALDFSETLESRQKDLQLAKDGTRRFHKA